MEEIVYTIKGLKDGLICLITKEKTYIKKNSLIKELPGYRKIILSLNNRNFFSSKILKFYSNDFEINKEINIANMLGKL